jgi:hypothetical protein
VPYFNDSLAQPGPYGEKIAVTKADWNPVTKVLTIWAINDGLNAVQVYVGGLPMTWSAGKGRWEYEISQPFYIPQVELSSNAQPVPGKKTALVKNTKDHLVILKAEWNKANSGSELYVEAENTTSTILWADYATNTNVQLSNVGGNTWSLIAPAANMPYQVRIHSNNYGDITTLVQDISSHWPPPKTGTITQGSTASSWDLAQNPDRLRVNVQVGTDGRMPKMRLNGSGAYVDIACTWVSPNYRCQVADNTLITKGYDPYVVIYTGASPGEGSVLTYKINNWGVTQSPLLAMTNIPPTAVADTYDLAMGTTGAQSFAVMANDTDTDAGTLTLVEVGSPSHGGTALITGTTISYTPAAGYKGAERFTYTISDGTDTATALVTVFNDDGIDDPPVAVNDVVTGILKGSTGNIIDVLANDYDHDFGDAITITSVSAASSDGTVEIVEGGHALVLSYSPQSLFTGLEVFTYTIRDALGNTSTASVTATVVLGPSNHTTFVAGHENCVICHDGSAGTSTTTPVDPNDNLIHDACTTCHQEDGTLLTVAQANNPATAAEVVAMNASGDCTGCHGQYFSMHKAINHVNRVAGGSSCNSCHPEAAGSVNGVPTDPADNKKHDSCFACHAPNGLLRSVVTIPVAELNAWQNVYSAVPTATSGNTGTTITPFTVGTGYNRLFMVAVAMENGTATATSTVSVTYGGTTLTPINKTGAARDHVWLGYLNEAQLKALEALNSAPKQLTVNWSITGTNNVTGVHVKWGSYTGCDQTLPITATSHAANYNGATSPSVTFGAAIAYQAYGKTVYAAANGATTADVTTPPTGFGATSLALEQTSGFSSKVGQQTPTPEASGSYLSTTAVTFSGTTTQTGLVVAALNPVANQVIPTNVINISAGDCENCHGPYFPNHKVQNHSVKVGGDPACITCHTATAGTASTVPVDGIPGNLVHDACTSCHDSATGYLRTPYGKASAMPSGGGGCQACHVNYFDQHLHNHDVSHAVGTDLSQAAPGAPCRNCHDDAGLGKGTLALTSWNAIGLEHDVDGNKDGAGACGTCHSYDGAKATPLAATQSAIATGTAVKCLTCHTDKGSPATHSGTVHAFTFAGNCANCHAGADTVAVAHKGNCGGCHVDPYGGSELKGLALGKTSSSSCTDCHTDKATSFFNHAVAHDTVVAGDASCTNCHSATAGTATTIPLSTIDHKVHDQCASCHVEATGVLRSPWGTAQAMTAGTCVTCHGAYMPNHTHSHTVTQTATDLAQAEPGQLCSNCHLPTPLGLTSWESVFAEHLSDCNKCHASARSEVTTAIAAKANPTTCLNCHSAKATPATHGGHGVDFGKDATCTTTCHTGASVLLNIHGNGTAATCTICHAGTPGRDNEKTGDAANGSDGNATLANGTAADGTWATTTCLTCHPPATFPTGGIHHDTSPAATNNCTLQCHTASNHSTLVNATGTTCLTCHAAAAGTATGAPVDMGNGRIHDACRTCHTFDASKKGVLVAATNKRGVTIMPAGGTASNDGGGLCTACHTTSSATIHHANAHTVIGECEYCHTDPRHTSGGSATFLEAAPLGGIPKHLPCEECHVTPKRGATVNGWTATAGQMTIYAFNEGSSHSTTDYSSDFSRTVAHSGGHVISNTVGQINNWGICFSCHGSGTAAQVNVFHAKPTTITATNLSCGTNGNLRYAPGREAQNTMANFDFFASTFRPASTRPGGSGSCKVAGDWTGAVKYGSTIFTATDLLVPDPWSTATNTLPMFAAQTAITTTTPSADNVKVTAATWNGTNLVVTATNSSGCTALTASYNGNNQAFSGTGICTATFGTGVVYTSSVPTLNVTTTNAEGLGVSGYRITVP